MNRFRDNWALARTGTITATPFGGASGSNAPFNHGTYQTSYELTEDTDYGREVDNEIFHHRGNIHEPVDTHSWATSVTNSQTSYVRWTAAFPGYRWKQRMATDSSAPFGYHGNLGLPSIGKTSIISACQPLIADSINAMLPGIRPSLLSLNSLYELKDLRRLPDTVRKVLSLQNRLKTVLKGVKKKQFHASAPARTVLSTSSDAYLSFEFGIGPLLSDIASAYSGLTSVRKQLKKLLENEGKRRIARFTRTIPDLVTPTNDTSVYVSGQNYSGDHFRRIVERDYEPTFRAVLEYSYRLDRLSSLDDLTAAYLDRLGVNLNPQIIWNAIPFSFVLDWVVNIDSLLGQFARKNLEPVTVIYRYCWSAKLHRRVVCKTRYSVGGPVSTSEIPIRTQDEEVYYRQPYLPSWDYYLKVSGLNSKEFSYTGALIGARL